MDARIPRRILHEVNSTPVLALVCLLHVVDVERRWLIGCLEVSPLIKKIGHPLGRFARKFSSDVITVTNDQTYMTF